MLRRVAAGLLLPILAAPASAGLPLPTPPKLDAHGHPLPPGAVARLGDFARRGGHVYSCTFSPDSKLVARSLSVRTEVRETATGRDVTPPWVRTARGEVRFTPAGELLHLDYRAGKYLVRQFDTGAVVLDLSSPGKALSGLFDAPDGGFVALVGGRGGACHLRLFERGGELRPDGRVIAAPYSGRQFMICPGGRWVVATEGQSTAGLHVFDAATGEHLYLYPFGPQGDPNSWAVTFLPLPDEDTVLVALADRLLPIRIGQKGAKEDPPIPLPQVGRLGLGPDGKSVLATDHSGQTWRIAWPGGKPEQVPDPRPKPPDGWYPAVESPDRTWAVHTHRFRPDRVVETATGRVTAEFPALPAVDRLRLSPGGRVQVLGLSGMREYDLASGALRLDRPYPELPPAETPVDVSPDGRLFAVASEGVGQGLSVRDFATGRERWKLAGVPPRPHAPVFEPAGRTVRVWVGNRSLVYDAGSRAELADPPPPGTLSPDGRLVVWRNRPPVPVIEVATGEVRVTLALPPNARENMFAEGYRFSADGRLLAGFAPNHGAVVWAVADGSLLYLGNGRTPEGGVAAGDLSPDGRWLAAAGSGDGLVRVWDWAATRGQKRDVQLAGDPWGVRAVAFTPDGKYLLTGGHDGTILVWDVARFERRSRVTADRADADDLWGELGSHDAAAAGKAVATLAARPDAAVRLARRHLPPVGLPSSLRLAALVADLGSDDPPARDRAEAELGRMADTAAGALRWAVRSDVPERRRRAERLLARLNGPVRDPARLLALRAVEVVERAGTPDARELLVAWAAGADTALLTRETKAALARLADR